ncbi:MAG: hypothetical protein JHC61_08130 [Burkholderiaceae bacterium]|nr:hypothetical protein [Burkholderiaceae bacterium]
MPARASHSSGFSPNRRPFLLTAAWARVCLALVVSAALWAMTLWALG